MATEEVSGGAVDVPDPDERANHRYYFETGVGRWAGRFSFDLTDREALREDDVGLLDRLLVLSMAFLIDRFGDARITSVLEGHPDEGPAGVVTNEVRVTKWRIPLYLLRERYLLHPDGRGVTVDSRERFGPIPFLLATEKAHPAEILDRGERAVYYLPLLGTDWIGRYSVEDGGDRIEAELTCDWAKTEEDIHRVD